MGMWEDFKGLFKRKKKLVALFIDETGRWYRKEKRYQNNTFTESSFSKEPQEYIVDQSATGIEHKSGLPVSLYHVNNPEPIRNPDLLIHRRKQELDAIGFKKILDSKAIQDLFTDDRANILMILLILVGACLIFILIIGMKVFNIIKWAAK